MKSVLIFTKAVLQMPSVNYIHYERSICRQWTTDQCLIGKVIHSTASVDMRQTGREASMIDEASHYQNNCADRQWNWLGHSIWDRLGWRSVRTTRQSISYRLSAGVAENARARTCIKQPALRALDIISINPCFAPASLIATLTRRMKWRSRDSISYRCSLGSRWT